MLPRYCLYALVTILLVLSVPTASSSTRKPVQPVDDGTKQLKAKARAWLWQCNACSQLPLSRREMWMRAGDVPKGASIDPEAEASINRLENTIVRNRHCSVTFLQPDAAFSDVPSVVGTIIMREGRGIANCGYSIDSLQLDYNYTSPGIVPLVRGSISKLVMYRFGKLEAEAFSPLRNLKIFSLTFDKFFSADLAALRDLPYLNRVKLQCGTVVRATQFDTSSVPIRNRQNESLKIILNQIGVIMESPIGYLSQISRSLVQVDLFIENTLPRSIRIQSNSLPRNHIEISPQLIEDFLVLLPTNLLRLSLTYPPSYCDGQIDLRHSLHRLVSLEELTIRVGKEPLSLEYFPTAALQQLSNAKLDRIRLEYQGNFWFSLARRAYHWIMLTVFHFFFGDQSRKRVLFGKKLEEIPGDIFLEDRRLFDWNFLIDTRDSFKPDIFTLNSPNGFSDNMSQILQLDPFETQVIFNPRPRWNLFFMCDLSARVIDALDLLSRHSHLLNFMSILLLVWHLLTKKISNNRLLGASTPSDCTASASELVSIEDTDMFSPYTFIALVLATLCSVHLAVTLHGGGWCPSMSYCRRRVDSMADIPDDFSQVSSAVDTRNREHFDLKTRDVPLV